MTPLPLFAGFFTERPFSRLLPPISLYLNAAWNTQDETPFFDFFQWNLNFVQSPLHAVYGNPSDQNVKWRNLPVAQALCV